MDGTIYFGTGYPDDNLYALNPADGSLKWQYADISDIRSLVIGADGTVYCTSNYNYDNLCALNPADGSLKCQYTINGPISSARRWGRTERSMWSRMPCTRSTRRTAR